MGKRRVSTGGCDTKRHKANIEFAKLVSAENQAEYGDDLAAIIRELLEHPRKIKNCRRAVMTDSFDPDAMEKLSTTFAPSVSYMSKVPKDFLKAFLPSVTELTQQQLKIYEKKRVGTVAKILCRQCQVDMASPNVFMEKRTFEVEMAARAAKVGKVEYVESASESIDWEKSGWFSLQPTFGGNNGERANHLYTMVKFQPSGITVLLYVMFASTC